MHVLTPALLATLALHGPVLAQELGSGSVESSIAVTGTFDFVRVLVGPGPPSGTSVKPPLLERVFPLGDSSGTRVVVDSGPAFDAAVGALTNGVTDWMFFEFEFWPGGGSGGSAVFEQDMVDVAIDCPQGPDFAGTTIQRFEIELETLVLTQPPVLVCQEDGFAADCTVVEHAVTVRVIGFEGVLGEQTVRLGSPPNPDALVPAPTGPTVGVPWSPWIDHGTFAPDALVDVLIVSERAANLTTPWGTLLCATAGPPPALRFPNPPGTAFAIPVPDDCGLVGLELCTQVATISKDATIVLTNALDVRVGNL